jgi:hypothetical protein
MQLVVSEPFGLRTPSHSVQPGDPVVDGPFPAERWSGYEAFAADMAHNAPVIAALGIRLNAEGEVHRLTGRSLL